MFIKLKALLVVSPIITLLGLTLLGARYSRDCFAGDRPHVYPLALVCALVISAFFIYWFWDTKAPAESFLKFSANIVIGFGIIGFLCSLKWIEGIPRMTATTSRTFVTTYDSRPGWKNCRFGAQFEDDTLDAWITVCGPRWDLPKATTPQTIQVTEQISPYGVYIIDIKTTAANSGQ